MLYIMREKLLGIFFLFHSLTPALISSAVSTPIFFYHQQTNKKSPRPAHIYLRTADSRTRTWSHINTVY